MNTFQTILVVLIASLSLLSGPAQAQQSCNPNLPETTPTADFTVNGDGTVTHNTTGLMWMRCALGQSWDGTTCTETAAGYTWSEALTEANGSTFAGFDDWRLPNTKELRSLVEAQCISPSINTTVFPATPSTPSLFYYFWSASGNASSSVLAWGLGFNDGLDVIVFKGSARWVRLVRGGQLFDNFNSNWILIDLFE